MGGSNVALRKESVDRNCIKVSMLFTFPEVALRKESVDRNFTLSPVSAPYATSLSARRAWIEIKYVVKDSDFSGVALRKESVDRNCR